MCVIIHAKKFRPDLETLKKCEYHNGHGGGVAWFEPDPRFGGTKVVWSKGLDAKEIFELVQSKPLPMVIHFRIATAGGISKFLTHPFAISPKSELFVNGQARAVLFHNGHVRDLDVVTKVLQLPRLDGVESDSRVMAQICSKVGHDWLKEFASFNRFAVMKDGEITRYGTWTKVRGTWYSNDYWNNRATTSPGSSSGGKYRKSYTNSCGFTGDEYSDHFPYYRREVSSATSATTNPPKDSPSTPKPTEGAKTSMGGSGPETDGNGLDTKAQTNAAWPGHKAGCVCGVCTSVHRERLEEAARTHAADCNCNLCMELWKQRIESGKHADDCNCQPCIDERWDIMQRRAYQKLPGVQHYAACECSDCLKACHGAIMRHDERCTCDRCIKLKSVVEDHGLICDCPSCRAFAASRYFKHGAGCRCWFCRKTKAFLDRDELLALASTGEADEKQKTTTTETPAPVAAPETGSTPVPVTIVPADEDASGK